MKPLRTYLNPLALFFLLAACAPTTPANTADSTNVAVAPVVDSSAVALPVAEESTPQETYFTPDPAEINDCGVVRLKMNYQLKKLSIYNEDGSLWRTYVYSDDADPDIEPFRMKPDYGLIVFRCLGKSPAGYQVVVHEEKNTIKYIKPEEPGFVHESWEDHVLGLNGIGFNYKTNPLRESPSDNAETVPDDKSEDVTYKGVSIEGDWLLVETENGTKGWIKWKDEKGYVTIELYYLC